MAEEIKYKILKFLQQNSGSKFNVKQISEELNISYSTCLKWIEVLRAEGKIDVEDWGNVKIIKISD